MLGKETNNRKQPEEEFHREFLNDGIGTAFVHTEMTTYLDKNGNPEDHQIFVTLSDCSRQISLDFYHNDEKSRQERLNKVDRLLHHFGMVKAKLEATKWEGKETKK